MCVPGAPAMQTFHPASVSVGRNVDLGAALAST